MTPKEKLAVEELESRYRRVSIKPSDAIPSLLYHYTSAAGLVGIVSSGILRASNFSYLNDSTEIHYGRRVVLDVIRERLAAESRSTRREMLARVDQALEDLAEGFDFYLTCFCTDPDMLSQWRAYGSPQGRFCLGFETEEWPPNLRFSGVIYERDEQREKVQYAIKAGLWALKSGSGGDFIESVAALIADELTHHLCFFKHPGFAEEQEWRVVDGATSDQVQFDTSGGFVKPFIDFGG